MVWSSARRRVVAASMVFAMSVAVAFALKLHYSRAAADDLRWILSPTTWLTERFTAVAFTWESGAGYVSRETMFVIAPSCAGINFLIIAFGMLVLAFVRPRRCARDNLMIAGASAVAAYAAAIVANTARIIVALSLHTHRVSAGFLTPERLHLLVGIAVYLGMLFVLLAAANRIARGQGRSLQMLVFPTACYLGGTLVVPILNGAAERNGFWNHSLLVLGAAVAFSAALLAARTVWMPRTATGNRSARPGYGTKDSGAWARSASRGSTRNPPPPSGDR